jgi:hypothetical protein
LRRWKLVGFAGIGAGLLALGMLCSAWRGPADGADVTPPVRFEAPAALGTLAPEPRVLRSALAISFAASASVLGVGREPDPAPLPLDLTAAGFAARPRPVALSEPPLAALALAVVAGLRALACHRRAI